MASCGCTDGGEEATVFGWGFLIKFTVLYLERLQVIVESAFYKGTNMESIAQYP